MKNGPIQFDLCIFKDTKFCKRHANFQQRFTTHPPPPTHRKHMYGYRQPDINTRADYPSGAPSRRRRLKHVQRITHYGV